MSKKLKLPSLEESLSEVATLIETMEHGNISLEQSMERFERGIHLIKHCQKVLLEAEQKVQILLQNNGKDQLEPYESTEE